MLSRIYLLYDREDIDDEGVERLLFIGEREKAKDKAVELIELTKDDYAEGYDRLIGSLRYRLSEVTLEDGTIVNQKNIDI